VDFFRTQAQLDISEVEWFAVYSVPAVIATVSPALAELHNEVRLIMFKVRRFEQYEERMRAKWGPDVFADQDSDKQLAPTN